MSMSDNLSLVVCSIKNAYAVGKETVVVPNTKLVRSVLSVLAENGYVVSFEVDLSAAYKLRVRLRLDLGKKVILSRMSRPGLRKYSPVGRIPRVMGGAALVIVSTAKGVMSGINAKKAGVGGELLCFAF